MSLDLIDTAARMLSLALNGSSLSTIFTLNPHLRQEEIRWILGVLTDNKLLERDPLSIYWTTADGIKFLEIYLEMERILRHEQKSLI